MVKEVPIVPWGHKIKSKGIYNIEDLYVELQLWFVHMDYKWSEVEYKRVGFPGGGHRDEMIWIGEKDLDDYSKAKIKISLAADVKDVEVTLDGGKKVKRQKCTLEFRSGSWIYRDWDAFPGKGKEGYWGILQRKLYEYLIRGRLRQQETDIWIESQKLFDELKAFMMLYPHKGA